MVFAMGLGCMSWTGFYGPADETESVRVMTRALELGVDFWDTSNVYGNGSNETMLGKFFAEDKTRRARVKLATKFGIVRKPNGERVFDNSEAHMIEQLEGSLRRLGTDHVELYYVHRVEPGRPVEEITAALAKQVKAGKISGIGFSEIAPDTLRRAHAVHPVTAVQSEYSLWTRGPELGMIQACRDLGVAFVPFGAVGRGVLSGEVRDPATFGPNDFRRGTPRFVEPNWSRNLAYVTRFQQLAADKGLKPAMLALAWVLARGDHLIPIPGTRSVAHLEDNVRAAAIKLSPGEITEIERILPAGFAAGDRYSDAQWYGAERYG
jgi:aryl-alcohol dehydrogenase-like predicted oxidoreductase